MVQRHSLQKLTDEDTGPMSKETDSEIHSDAAPLGSTCSLDEQGYLFIELYFLRVSILVSNLYNNSFFCWM